MKFSAPLYQLKRKARLLSRDQQIPLHEALDRVARLEGFAAWSLLAAKAAARSPAATLYAQLAPGDLLLLGARPGQGKTLLGLELAVEAMKAGNRAVFFTLEYTAKDIADRFRAIGVERAAHDALFAFDGSDDISADYIVARLGDAPSGTLAVVDYLQLLDQKRSNPELSDQIRTLQGLAREKGLVFVFISQIDRRFDPALRPVPGLQDVRLPNRLDLSLFSKTCFLNDGEVRFGTMG
ncbi:MAG: DNA helicase [Reyranellaceae bacterium]